MQSDSIDEVVAGLQVQGWCQSNRWLTAALCNQLRKDLHERREQLRPAGVGRTAQHRLAPAVRGDTTLWLDGASQPQRLLLEQMDVLRVSLNRSLFLGLSSCEAHYAVYAPGTSYRRHLDAFQGNDRAAGMAPGRVLSVVIYLNEPWVDADGGELVLFDEADRQLIRIVPRSPTCVFFLSAAFAHEVLPTRATRYSIAAWFRADGGGAPF